MAAQAACTADQSLSRTEWKKSLWDYLDPLLAGADGLWVDFFPDELSNGLWIGLRVCANKMFFLPPFLGFPPQVGHSRQKLVFVSDRPVKAIYPPRQELSSAQVSISYDPPPLKTGLFEKNFDFVHLQRADDLAGIMNAPGWVLNCQNLHVEQAVCAIAQKYGIKISFWDRSYSSALRSLAGHPCPFDIPMDKNLRQRLQRVSQVSRLLPPKEKAGGAEEDVSNLIWAYSYGKLGLLAEFMDFNYVGRVPSQEIALPPPFRDALKDAPLMLSLSGAIQKLEKLLPPESGVSLVDRLWVLLLWRIFLLPDTDAWCLWYYSFARYPERVVKATRRILETGFEKRQNMRAIIKTILQSILYYDINGSGIGTLLDDLEKTRESWQAPDSDAWGAQITALFSILRGENPSKSLASNCVSEKEVSDVFASYGVRLIRSGMVEDGLRAIRKDMDSATLTDFGWRLSLKSLSGVEGPVLDEFLDRCVPLEKACEASFIYTQCNICGIVGKIPRAKSLSSLGRMCQKLKDGGLDNRWNLLMYVSFITVLGRGGEALSLCRERGMTSDMGLLIHLSTLNFLMHEYDLSAQVLDLMWDAPANNYETAHAAVLNWVLGQRDRGIILMKRLKTQCPSFWEPLFVSPASAMLIFLLGVLGRACADEKMAQLALRRLDVPEWEDRRAYIMGMASSPMAIRLDEEFREWILRSLE